MDDLKLSLIIRQKYNSMPFEEFVDMVDKYTGKTTTLKEFEEWKYTGLNNVDFFITRVGEPPFTEPEELPLHVVSGSVCDVFTSEECIFQYCPHPDVCKIKGCQ